MKTRIVKTHPIANYPLLWLEENQNSVINGVLVSKWELAPLCDKGFLTPLYVNNEWIEGATQADFIEQAKKSIDSAYDMHESKGKAYSKQFQRSLAGEFLIFKRLTETEAKEVGAALTIVFFILNEGQWKSALDEINLIAAPYPYVQPYLEKIRAEVETYIKDNYTA